MCMCVFVLNCEQLEKKKKKLFYVILQPSNESSYFSSCLLIYFVCFPIQASNSSICNHQRGPNINKKKKVICKAQTKDLGTIR